MTTATEPTLLPAVIQQIIDRAIARRDAEQEERAKRDHLERCARWAALAAIVRQHIPADLLALVDAADRHHLDAGSPPPESYPGGGVWVLWLSIPGLGRVGAYWQHTQQEGWLRYAYQGATCDHDADWWYTQGRDGDRDWGTLESGVMHLWGQAHPTPAHPTQDEIPF